MLTSRSFTNEKSKWADFDLPAHYGKNPVTERLKNISSYYSGGSCPISQCVELSPTSVCAPKSSTGVYYCQNNPVHR